jgi:hypothetical protein
MISEAQLRELLAQKTETKNLDFKERLNWNTAGNDDKCELVKDILAFLNTQDGGQIIFGVQNNTFKPIGLSEDDFSSFDTTKVNDFLQKYTDPISSCEVQKLALDRLLFVAISIAEFRDVPVICKKDAHSNTNPSKLILKAGSLYVRTEKATSVLVPSAENMRDLMNRALLKRGDQLLSTIKTLLSGETVPKQQDLAKYEKELEAAYEYFRQSLPEEFESRGFWELMAAPRPYSPTRIAKITTVWKLLTEAEVQLRGWSFPYMDRDNQSNFESGRQSHTVHSVFGRLYVEAFRAYQSGLFVWRGAYREEHSDFVNKYGKALTFVDVIYEMTEMFVFLKRYYERVAPDASLRASITLHGIKNRRLISTEQGLLFGDFISRISTLPIERDYTVPDLRASAEELAIEVIQKIFEIFNWNNADPNMIRGWQQRLLSRTL